MSLDLANPYAGFRVRDLQEQLYRTVVNAAEASIGGDTVETHHLVREAFDMVAILRPGYASPSEE